ncbi:MAG: hypothetical protein JXM71_02640 [Spirochaetales bacterium]|nr:hypothetical protein [Spirochaetales bacterium]
MKRRVVWLMLIVTLAGFSGAYAIDFGADVSDVTSIVTQDTAVTLSQENDVLAWLSTPTGDSSSLYVSLWYRFSGDFALSADATTEVVPYAITAGRLEWEGFLALSENSGLAWSVGRVPFADAAKRVVDGTFDGARAVLNYGSIIASAGAGYTGLTFKEDALILLDADDEERWADDGGDAAAMFARKHLFAFAGVRAIEPLPMLDAGVDLWAQFDIDEGVATHTQYLEPYVEGRLNSTVGWRWFGIVELGQEDATVFYSLASGGRVGVSLPDTMGLSLAASLSWASGDHDGDAAMRAFEPMTNSPIAIIGSTAFSDALALSLDGALAPLPGLSVSANVSTLFQPGAEGAAAYLGSEGSVRAAYQLAEDVALSVSGGAFVPGSATESAMTLLGSLSARINL